MNGDGEHEDGDGDRGSACGNEDPRAEAEHAGALNRRSNLLLVQLTMEVVALRCDVGVGGRGWGGR